MSFDLKKGNHNDEMVPRDDSVIARATRRSAVFVLMLAVLVAAAIYAHRSIPSARPFHALPPALFTPIVAEPVPPAVRFTDITKSAGISFRHVSGGTGEKLLPETMGGGVAWIDYDNDERPDLLFVNSANLAHPLALFHNDGNGHFTDVSATSGLSCSIYGMGVAVGDYDNDGREDIFITGVDGCRLFHNEGGGHFRDVTIEAGVGGSADDWSTSAAFFDYDNDGKLDLFVCNYVRWSRELDLKANYTLTGIGRAFGPPTGFEGSFCRLYHNDGDGHFTDVSAKAGIQVRNKDTGKPIGKSLGVIPVDLDGDGYVDLIVANDTVQNFVFHNNRDGTFTEIGIPSGVAFDTNGAARGGMGIDAAYFKNDTRLGVAVGNFANEMLGFYISRPAPDAPLRFTDDAVSQGVGGQSRLPLKFGVEFFDYDLDGWLDLLCVDGHIERDIALVHGGEKYAQAAQLYWNAGAAGGNFVASGSRQNGPDSFKPIVGRACAVADIDGDGDLDVVLTQIDGPPVLLRNDQNTGHHFLRFKLTGEKCNRDAIGAAVLVKVNGRTLRREVNPTHGYLSQSELPVTIGLGDCARPESVRIIWPGGQEQIVRDFNVDRLTEIRQPPK